MHNLRTDIEHCHFKSENNESGLIQLELSNNICNIWQKKYSDTLRLETIVNIHTHEAKENY